MVVGCAMSERMTANIVVSDLDIAFSRVYAANGFIFHSDYAAESAKPQNPCARRTLADLAA
jgi:hypothetical protein